MKLFGRYMVSKTIQIIVCITGVAFMATGSYAWDFNTSNFPDDPAVPASRLENMRAGQVRDAVEKGVYCLVPVVTLEAACEDMAVGFDPGQWKALEAMARDLTPGAVISPPIWYAPTGYIISGPDQGTFDMSLDAFARYLEQVLVTLSEVGFKKIQIVMIHNPQAAEGAVFEQPDRSPLYAVCKFVGANLFNDRWKDPEIGQNWWSGSAFSATSSMPAPACQENGLGKAVNLDRMVEVEVKTLAKVKLRRRAKKTDDKRQLPLRLEHMSSDEIKRAVAENLPCFVPAGVIENHGNQNPVGCDAFEAMYPVLDAAAKEAAVVAPTVWYGPTGYAVTGPKLATTDIDGYVYKGYIQGVCDGLIAMGFKNIIFVQVHQGEGYSQWTCADMAIAEYRCRLHRDKKGSTDAANIEVIAPPLGQYDHAGKHETSWMLYYLPQYTDMKLIRAGDYSFNDHCMAKEATVEWGREMAVGKDGKSGTVGAFEERIRRYKNASKKSGRK